MNAMSKTDFSFIRYSNCWEDTHVLLKALDIRENETGISIASAGDNTLAMLIKNPRRIYAFDLNETQLFCCELKMACFRCLSYNEMLVFLGVRNGRRMPMYKKLRHVLSKEARSFFDANPDIIIRGIIHVGKFENFFSIFRKYIIPLFSTQKQFRCFARMEDLGKQLNFYHTYINNRRLKAIFRIYFGYKVMGKLGRDSNFYNHVKDKESSGNDIRKRFEYGISHTVNAYNPYISYIVFGGYSKHSLPLYLRRENFDVIRRNINRITLVKGDLLSLETEKIDFANLSDIFEYMSVTDFNNNIQKLSEMMKINGRVAYWNMQNRRYISKSDLCCDYKLSQNLFKQNNSWFYRDFLLYRKVNSYE